MDPATGRAEAGHPAGRDAVPCANVWLVRSTTRQTSPGRRPLSTIRECGKTVSRSTARRRVLAGAGLAALAVVLSGCTAGRHPADARPAQPGHQSRASGSTRSGRGPGSPPGRRGDHLGPDPLGGRRLPPPARRRRARRRPATTCRSRSSTRSLPLIIIAVLFCYTARDQTRDHSRSATHPDHTVNVVGFRWNWTLQLPRRRTPTTSARRSDLPTLYLPVERDGPVRR